MAQNQNSEIGEINFDELKTEFSFDLPKQSSVETQPEEVKPTEDVEEVVDTTNTEEVKEEVDSEVETTKPDVEAELENLEVEKPRNGQYNNIVKTLIESGQWEDVLVKDGENEIVLSEMEDISEEDFKHLIEEQKALKEEDLKAKYIPIDTVDEDRKNLISIISNGGDLQEIFKSPEALIKPFSEELGWNIEDEEHQASIVYQQYIAQGIEEDRAVMLVQADKKDLKLDEKAKSIVAYHQEQFSNKIKKEAERVKEEKKTEQENIKQYRSNLSKLYKDEKLPESQIKKLVDLATRESDGELAIDTLYSQVMKNPEDAKDLIFFLSDKQKFLESKMSETKLKTNVDTFRKISRIPKSSSKDVTKEAAKRDSGFTFELPKDIK